MAARKSPKAIGLVMAGGSGTRFWPLSRPSRPKQFLKLISGKSLLRETIDRLSGVVPPEGVFICAAASQKALLLKEFPRSKQLILEPTGRNTAACLMLSVATLLVSGVDPRTPMIALSSDHFIKDIEAFRGVLRRAMQFAVKTAGLVTLGIRPSFAHTGYGYIEARGDAGEGFRKVDRFVEKPNRESAEKFLKLGGFYWNSGMFVWTLAALKGAFERHTPGSWEQILSALDHPVRLKKIYASLPSLPIDTAVMEKADNLYMFPCDFDWSDIGSWDALHGLKSGSASENVTLTGDVRSIESQGCLVHTDPKRKVALVGVQNLIVVEDGDTLLICDRDSDQKVRDASKAFEPASLRTPKG